MLKPLLAGMMLAACCQFLAGCSRFASTGALSLNVMSFNIRYAAADDGANGWNNRRDFVAETIRAHDPDIMGLQEALASQLADLRAALPGYSVVGVGRDDGVAAGEFAPILYRSRRFTLRDQGHFWLSEHPETPGSVGWDAALPRIATWVRLSPADAPDRELLVLNTHMDHQGQRARLESAKLIRRFVETSGQYPLIILGDFNCDPASEPYRALTGGTAAPGPLTDAFSTVNDSGGTYHAFTGIALGGRIDWILFDRRFECLIASVDRRSSAGRYPSDHFPVAAALRLRH